MLPRPGCASPTGRHGKLPVTRAGHETSYLPRGPGINSHLCRGDMRQFRTFVHCHICRSRPQYVRLRTIYDRTVGGAQVTEMERGSRIWIHSVAILLFVQEFYVFLYVENKRILIWKELKAGLIILIIRKKSDFNTLKNCILSSCISFLTKCAPFCVPLKRSGRC
jgi:hypothetical protein